jgi:hypothetical protein
MASRAYPYPSGSVIYFKFSEMSTIFFPIFHETFHETFHEMFHGKQQVKSNCIPSVTGGIGLGRSFPG